MDIINFGEEAENTSRLEAFINNVNNSDNSHLVTIPPGPHLLSDMLISTPIIAGEDGAAGNFGASSGGDFEFGIDPSLDPELALVSDNNLLVCVYILNLRCRLCVFHLKKKRHVKKQKQQRTVVAAVIQRKENPLLVWQSIVK